MKKIFSIGFLPIIAFYLQIMPTYSQELCAEKLNKIIINKAVFDETDVVDAFEFVRKISKEKDPNGKGINIILVKLNKGEHRVTLDLSDIPAGDLIRYICMATNLEYKVDQFAVIVSKKKVQKSKADN